MNENQEREIEELKAKLDTVTRERDVAIKAIDKAIAIGNRESVRELELTQAVCDEALAKLAARDTAIAEYIRIFGFKALWTKHHQLSFMCRLKRACRFWKPRVRSNLPNPSN